MLNDIILRAINAADVPAVKEPSGLNTQDGKRPDGLSLIPLQSGKPLLWDVTVASTLAGSYVDTAATGAELVADQAADSKTAKYADLRAQHVFQPVSVENLGPFSSARSTTAAPSWPVFPVTNFADYSPY